MGPKQLGSQDAALVAECLKGEKAAFEMLCTRYHAYAVRIASRLCTRRSEIEDIVQESYLRAYLGLASLKRPDLFKGWLVGIVVNVGREFARDRENPAGFMEDVSLSAVERSGEPGIPMRWAADPASVFEDEELKRLVVQTVLELPITMREPALLFYFEGLSLKEIAELLGISSQAVRTRLSRTRGVLRQKLRSRGISE